MNRVLLIAYSFPPDPVPGAQRPAYIARYAPAFGWHATVLTRSAGIPPFPLDIVRAGASKPAPSSVAPATNPAAPRSTLRRLLRPLKEAISIPDELALWIPVAVLCGVREMRRRRYDAIVTTALPLSSHVVGACLSRITGVPWIADYRDAWSGNPYMPWSHAKRSLQTMLERAVIRCASHLTTVSDPIARHLEALHGLDVTVIENAYDAAEWDSVPEERPAEFSLTYTGTMYAGKRSADLLFRALAELQKEGHPLAAAAQVHFYGHNNESVLEEARRYALEDRVHLHGVVSRVEAMHAQRRSAGLLIFLNMDPATASERGSKYLEYAGARRPMLVFGPPESAMQETVRRARLGWFAADSAAAKTSLVELYERYTAGAYQLLADSSALLSSVELARRFGICLDRVTNKRRGTARAAREVAI
jgi:glycosyltransferase involved in cell wall biosynthesis